MLACSIIDTFNVRFSFQYSMNTRVKKEISAYDKALELIVIRPHSERELVLKLRRKGYSQSDSEEAVGRLREQRLIDDRTTAAFYLEGLMKRKTYGYYYAQAKMMAKGFEKSLIDDLLNKMFTPEEEEKIARKFMASQSKKGEKLLQALQRRGFKTEAVMRVLRD